MSGYSARSRKSICTTTNFSEFNHNPNKGQWGSKWQFMSACLGQTVGIRNLFLFGYFYETCGGVAFLCAVLLLSPLLATPCFFQESFMGQFSRTGFVSVFRVVHLCKGLGFIMLFLNIGSVIYFSVISAYPLVFIYKLFNYEAPWNIDGHNITTDFFLQDSDPVNRTSFDDTSVTSIYFLQKVKEVETGWFDSSFIEVLIPLVICIWIIVLACVYQGQKSINVIGYIAHCTTSAASILLIIISLRNFFPVGNVAGVNFFNVHDLRHLGELRTWMGAGIVIMHTLSKTWGLVTALSSLNEFGHSLKLPVIGLPYAGIILTAFGIMPVLIFANFLKDIGISVVKVKNGGLNLAFILYPDFVAYIGESQAWSICFYAMLFLFEFHGILLQTISIITSFLDEFAPVRMKYKYAVTLFCICLCAFSVGLAAMGMYTPCDQLLLYSILAQLVCFLMENLIFTWSYVNKTRFAFDIKFVFGEKNIFYKYLQKLVMMIPLWILALFIYWSITGMHFLPPQTKAWHKSVTVSFFGLCLASYPGYTIFKMIFLKSKRKMTFSERLYLGFSPLDWHPAEPNDHQNYFEKMDEYKSKKLEKRQPKKRVSN